MSKKFLKGKNIISAFRDKELLFHPAREWITGLFFATGIFVIGVILISLDFYNQFYAVEDDTPVVTHSIEYNAKEVHSYAEKFNAKEKAFNALRQNRVYVAPTPVGDVPISTPVETSVTEPEPLADVRLGQ